MGPRLGVQEVVGRGARCRVACRRVPCAWTCCLLAELASSYMADDVTQPAHSLELATQPESVATRYTHARPTTDYRLAVCI